MGYGLWGSFPFEYGGGPTDEETTYNALRSAVGEGGSAANDDGIDGLLRRCRAIALAAGDAAVERAALQAFPQFATDHIPVYEEEYGIVPPEGATEQDRRLAIVAAYTAKVAENEVELAVGLAAIDSRLAPVAIPRAKAWYVQAGKAFEPQDGVPGYGPSSFGAHAKSTPCPNASSDFYVPVQLTIGTTLPTPTDVASIAKAKAYLRVNLSSWVDFAVLTSTGPFTLDVSPLDLTCMS
jgi:hypothetical protein